MKILSNISKMLPVLALMLAGTMTMAGNASLPDITFTKLNSGRKVSVQINQLKSEATIRIIDLEERELAVQTIAPGELQAVRVFNLENLAEGKYRFVVATPQKETLQPFEITADDVVIRSEDRQAYLVPSVKVGTDYVDVSWFNGKLANMKVNITTPAGTVVFSDEMANVFKVERRYNLAQLERGEYTMIISTPYKTQYQRLTVK